MYVKINYLPLQSVQLFVYSELCKYSTILFKTHSSHPKTLLSLFILCVNYLPCYYDKIPDKGNLRKKRAILVHSSWEQNLSWQQEKSGHIVFRVRKQRDECLGSLCLLFFIWSKTLGHEKTLPTFRVGLLTSVNLIDNPCHSGLEICFLCVSKSHKLTVKINKLLAILHFPYFVYPDTVSGNSSLFCIFMDFLDLDILHTSNHAEYYICLLSFSVVV